MAESGILKDANGEIINIGPENIKTKTINGDGILGSGNIDLLPVGVVKDVDTRVYVTVEDHLAPTLHQNIFRSTTKMKTGSSSTEVIGSDYIQLLERNLITGINVQIDTSNVTASRHLYSTAIFADDSIIGASNTISSGYHNELQKIATSAFGTYLYIPATCKESFMAVGTNNLPNTESYFQIGNGKYPNQRHNVISIEEHGIWIGGNNENVPSEKIDKFISYPNIAALINGINNSKLVFKDSNNHISASGIIFDGYSSITYNGGTHETMYKKYSDSTYGVRFPDTANYTANKTFATTDLLTTFTGYDATKTQVLKNIQGTMTWVDE